MILEEDELERIRKKLVVAWFLVAYCTYSDISDILYCTQNTRLGLEVIVCTCTCDTFWAVVLNNLLEKVIICQGLYYSSHRLWMLRLVQQQHYELWPFDDSFCSHPLPLAPLSVLRRYSWNLSILEPSSLTWKPDACVSDRISVIKTFYRYWKQLFRLSCWCLVFYKKCGNET